MQYFKLEMFELLGLMVLVALTNKNKPKLSVNERKIYN